MDPVQLGEHSPFMAMVLGVISEKRDQILIAVVASLVSGAMMAGTTYAFLINDLKNDVARNREAIAKLEHISQLNQDNVNRNLLELVRQAGTDKLVAQQLSQISNRVDEINTRLAKIYDGEFSNGRRAYRGP